MCLFFHFFRGGGRSSPIELNKIHNMPGFPGLLFNVETSIIYFSYLNLTKLDSQSTSNQQKIFKEKLQIKSSTLGRVITLPDYSPV